MTCVIIQHVLSKVWYIVGIKRCIDNFREPTVSENECHTPSEEQHGNRVFLSKPNVSKNPVSPLNWNYVYQGGFGLSKEVLWVSLGQMAAKSWAVKVGG